jgi:hypothetical protein
MLSPTWLNDVTKMKRDKKIKEYRLIKIPCFDKDRGNENMVAANSQP